MTMNQIKKLEDIARLLDPDAVQRERLLNEVIGYTNNYMEKIGTDPAFNISSDYGKALYDFPITEAGNSINHILNQLDENVISCGLNPTSGRFLGYIPGGGLFSSAIGDYLAAITNRYSGVFFAGPGAVRMENMLLRWMAEIAGYPDTSAGNISSGGSIANLTAIVVARDTCGITGQAIDKSVVYFSEHVHHCIDKALHLAGLNKCIRRIVPVDKYYRMNSDELNRTIIADKKTGLNPWLIVASAGTINTGSVDPFKDISDVASLQNLWFHVDGAYGAFFTLCPEGKAILKGMDRSDSIVMDPHKTLFLPYGTGAVIVKDRQNLYASHNIKADYLQNIINDAGELSPADLSPELTKHFRGLRLWLPLMLHGVAPFRAALSEKIQLARYFYERIQEIKGFEVGPYPDLSVVIYRYLPDRGDADEFNHRLMQAIIHDGRIFISSTRVDGKLVLRVAVSCFRTHLDDINETLEILKRKARQLVEEEKI